MIARPPYELSLLEYFTLFPSVQSLDHTPHEIWNDWSYYRTRWFRPEEKEDIGCRLRIKERWLEKQAQQHKTPEDCEFNKSLDLTVRHYWHISLDYIQKEENGDEEQDIGWPPLPKPTSVKLTAEVTRLMSTTNRLQQLVIIYFSTPSMFESDAITQIFTECRQLKHATLNQLVGIGNSVFFNLPADECIRPALETLRIKTPCGVMCGVIDAHNDITFDARVIPKLVKTFPSIRHFELVLMERPQFDIICSFILSAVLDALKSSNKWPHLRALALNVTGEKEEEAKVRAIMLARAKMTGVKNPPAPPLPTSFFAPFGNIPSSSTHRSSPPPYHLQFVMISNRPDCNEWRGEYYLGEWYSAKPKRHFMKREKIRIPSDANEEVDKAEQKETLNAAEKVVDNRCPLEYVTERCCYAGQCLLPAHREQSTRQYHQDHADEVQNDLVEIDELVVDES